MAAIITDTMRMALDVFMVSGEKGKDAGAFGEGVIKSSFVQTMIYVITTFLSAFLLFMVQPMMGKLLLCGQPACCFSKSRFWQATATLTF